MKNAFQASGSSPTKSDAFECSGSSPTNPKSNAPAENPPTALPRSNVESRIDVSRFARILRQRLETRHPAGSAVRRLLDTMSDEEVVASYSKHARVQTRQHAVEDEAQRRHRTRFTVRDR